MSTLENHKFCHTGKESIKCDLCEKAFAQLVNLKTHKLCYTGENTIKCDLCEKAFVQLVSLTRHEICHTGWNNKIHTSLKCYNMGGLHI